MEKINIHNFQGFDTQKQEITIAKLPIKGRMPNWLSGSYISNGPAQFEIGRTQLNSWIDGFAMLKKFDFQEGQVHFQNRYLRSEQYIHSNANNKLHFAEFDTHANPSLFGRMAHMFKSLIKPDAYDNCNVNTIRLQEHYLALTESNQIVEFNPGNLATIGHFQFNDTLKANLFTAHPHWDTHRKETITVAIEIGKDITYHLCKIAANSTKRDIIKSYVSDCLFYMHSFSVTENYIILFKSPLMLNKYKLMFGMPFSKTLFWKKQQVSQFLIIDRRNNQEHIIETEAFLCLHSANAYEHKGKIILDLICYDTGANPYQELELKNLRSEYPRLCQSTLKRFALDLNTNECVTHVISDDNQEFPRLHYDAVNGKKYQFLYTNSLDSEARFFNEIRKTNLDTGQIKTWKNSHYYFSEPLFIPKPNYKTEDDGIIIAIAYIANTNHSALVCLDAHELDWIAEIDLPLILPFGLHSNFFDFNDHA